MSTVEDWVKDIVLHLEDSPKFFVEIGAAHRTHLGALITAGWDSVRLDRTEWEGVEQQLVTVENIDYILQHRVPDEFGLLLIDIDGNDYWIWKAIQQQKPLVVIIEYNALAPEGWIIPYDPTHYYDGSDWFGASLEAFSRLGHERGYVLVECDDHGANALFLRRDLAVARTWRALQPPIPSHSPKWGD